MRARRSPAAPRRHAGRDPPSPARPRSPPRSGDPRGRCPRLRSPEPAPRRDRSRLSPQASRGSSASLRARARSRPAQHRKGTRAVPTRRRPGRSRLPSAPRRRQERARSPYFGEPSRDPRAGFRCTSRMKRLFTGLLLIAVLAGTAAAGVAKPERVLAVEWQAGGGKLRWVSPTTMRPVGSAVLNVGGAPADILATTPDGALAAIGGGENGRLRFVRLDGLRPAGLMWLGGASAYKGIWSAPDRLVVLVGGEAAEVVVVDPVARRVLHRE